MLVLVSFDDPDMTSKQLSPANGDGSILATAKQVLCLNRPTTNFATFSRYDTSNDEA
jgi:hypothetical protein